MKVNGCTYLIEEPHHLHERSRVPLIACDALDLRLYSLEELIQLLQHGTHLYTGVNNCK